MGLFKRLKVNTEGQAYDRDVQDEAYIVDEHGDFVRVEPSKATEAKK